MVARNAISPRKKPVQARSVATVGVLLDATARVLAREGYDRASTNRIAEAAGVSVGSLYQYFRSKESLVGALIDRHHEAMNAVFLRQVAAAGALPVREAARAVVGAMVDAHLVDPRLHRILVEQVPRIGKLGQLLEDLDTVAATAVRAYLASRPGELRVTDLDTATFVVVHAVEALVHRAILAPRRIERDVLVDAIVDLVSRYLAREPG